MLLKGQKETCSGVYDRTNSRFDYRVSGKREKLKSWKHLFQPTGKNLMVSLCNA